MENVMKCNKSCKKTAKIKFEIIGKYWKSSRFKCFFLWIILILTIIWKIDKTKLYRKLDLNCEN